MKKGTTSPSGKWNIAISVKFERGGRGAKHMKLVCSDLAGLKVENKLENIMSRLRAMNPE